MAPRICMSCFEPHITTDWYVVNEYRHPHRGDVECAEAHEDRIRRETRPDETLAQKLQETS